MRELISSAAQTIVRLWGTPTGAFGLLIAGVVTAWVIIGLRVIPRLPSSEPYDLEMELVEHLEELRYRLIRAILYLAVGAVLAWGFYGSIYTVLTAPIQPILKERGYKLVFMTITEAFFVRLQVSIIAGLILASPPILMELWGFIAPGLTPQERKPVRLVMPLAIMLFVMGVVLSYLILPKGLRWFASYIPGEVQLVQRMSDYLMFMIKMCLAFGAGFELPVVLMLLGQVGIVSSATMKRYWRQAVVLIMLIAAVLTPSNDPFSMLVMASPMSLLYGLSIILVRMVEPADEERQRRKRRRRRRPPQEPTESPPPLAEEAGTGAHADGTPPD